ncbi:MAG: hypothetical protein FK733_18505 [Asgard group archaeon]|nr:hypothetical protein [Asgard group archaeon]
MDELGDKLPIDHELIKENMRKLVNSDSRPEVICVYKILSKCHVISTNDIVKLAISPEYEKECISCASAESIYRGLRLLQELGLIVGKISKGGYVWQLVFC